MVDFTAESSSQYVIYFTDTILEECKVLSRVIITGNSKVVTGGANGQQECIALECKI